MTQRKRRWVSYEPQCLRPSREMEWLQLDRGDGGKSPPLRHRQYPILTLRPLFTLDTKPLHLAILSVLDFWALSYLQSEQYGDLH